MMSMERLLLRLLRLQVQHALDLLQFVHQENINVADSTGFIHNPYIATSLVQKGMFFLCVFNTIQLLILRNRFKKMRR